MRLVVVVGAIMTAALLPAVDAQERTQDSARRQGIPGRLIPTAHPPLPGHISQYWLLPDLSASRAVAGRRPVEDAMARLARGVRLIADGDFAAGLPLVNAPALASTPLASHAQFYAGVALLGLARLPDADATFTALLARKPEGYLSEAAVLRLAEVAMARGDAARAEDLLESLSRQTVSAPEQVLLQLGRAEEATGHGDHALTAYRRVYYDFPLTTEASDAQTAIERLETASLIPADRFARELARAEQLFAARRWAQARAGFAALAPAAQGESVSLIAIRLAECDYYLDRHRAARDGLRPYLEGGAREAEARFFYLTAVRALGDRSTYLTLAADLVADHGDNEWAAETLNNLATHHIQADEDADADRVFRELYRRFPQHRYSERAAWRIGWFAYRNELFAEAAETFEGAAARFPRADNRPAWLYWSGRARDRQGDAATANARYRLVVTDYRNSYYGRLATRILESRREPPVAPALASVAPSEAARTPGPTDALIRELLRAELYDEALREVQYAQRIWGDSSQLQATVAWIRHQQGLGLRATERFVALRGAITTMRRAYPQFLAAGGEELPPDVLRIIFPLDYWPLIRKYSDLHRLDPYLVAALMAQESTFTPEIRSAANAYGLMQIVPATGRVLARSLGIRRFTTSMLTQPETNVRMGTKYFKDMVDRFGGEYFALAGYNAGPHRVAEWLEESPGLPQDEFIDNIPFPETQNYVKRILGTAEDYRRLYGPGGVLDPNARLASSAPAARATAPGRR